MNYFVQAKSVDHANEIIKKIGYLIVIEKFANLRGYEYPEKELFSDKIEEKKIIGLWHEKTSYHSYIVHTVAYLHKNVVLPTSFTQSERLFLSKRGMFLDEFYRK